MTIKALKKAREALELAIVTSYSEFTNETFSAAIAAIDAVLAQAALTDEEIVEIAQTMGRKVPGVSDYDSWPGMGYGTDTNGKHTIPSVPDIALRFARAIERRVRGAK